MAHGPRLVRRWVVAALLVAAALGVWLLVGGRLRFDPAPRHEAGDEAASPSSAAGGDGAAGAASPRDAPAPVRLEGRAAPTVDREKADAHVRLVGPGGQGLEGVVLVVRRGDGQAEEEVVTGADGRVVLPDVPLDGSVALGVRRPAWQQEAGVVEDLGALRGRAVELAIPWGTPIELDLRDAGTGLPVKGVRWRMRLRMLRYTSPWATTGDGALTLPLRNGESAAVFFDVEAPDGYVDWDESRTWLVATPRVQRIRFVHPLRHEATVFLDVAASAGSSTLSPVALAWDAPGRTTRWTWQEPDLLGRLRLCGVPALAGAPLAVLVGDLAFASSYPTCPGFGGPLTRGGLPGTTLVETRFPEDASEDLLVQAVLPALDTRPPGPPYDRREVSTTEWNGPPRPRDWTERTADTSKLGSVRVEVRDREDRPCAGVWVEVSGARWGWAGPADGDGRVRLADRPAGHVTARVVDPVLITPRARFPMPADEETVVVLREIAGGVLAVKVVDAVDRPRPYAYLSLGGPQPIQGLEWLPGRLLERGVLVVDAHTDVEGRKRFLHLPPGTYSVRATPTAAEWHGTYPRLPRPGGRALWDAWHRGTTVEGCVVREGETTEVTLVVPP